MKKQIIFGFIAGLLGMPSAFAISRDLARIAEDAEKPLVGEKEDLSTFSAPSFHCGIMDSKNIVQEGRDTATPASGKKGAGKSGVGG